MKDDVKIAGRYTVKHWKKLRDKLPMDEDVNNKCWKKAFKIFKRRVNTRFINPIKAILNMYPEKKGKGEGFSVVALQCILVEFFEAFYQGKIYAYKEDKDLLKNEYNSSAKLIKDFLKTHEPFKSQFTKSSREKFYSEFRCGLLHEAATKKSSIIRTRKAENDNTLIEKDKGSDNIILYRTPFQQALEKYLEDYETKLMSSGELKENFKRKMDELCQL